MQPSLFAKLSLQEQLNEEKQPKLKLDEMIPIFQRLPTSELIRFISNMRKHPLGRFWSGGLKFVVEKRLPFSLKSMVANGNNCVITNHVIYDCHGAKVAEMKRPDLFHLSPLCELIEEAELPVRFCDLSFLMASLRRSASASHIDLNDICCLPLRLRLPALVNLNKLNLTFLENHLWSAVTPDNGRELAAVLTPRLMSQLDSLSLSSDYTSGSPNEAFNMLADLLPRATALTKLSVTETQLFALLTRRGIAFHHHPPSQRLTVTSVAMTTEVGDVFFGLESLTIERSSQELAPEQVLAFIRRQCLGLRELDLPVRGHIRDYIATFLALPHLAKLGLDAMDSKPRDLAVDDNAEPVTSVFDFCIRLNPYSNGDYRLLTLVSKFPNLRSLEVATCQSNFMLSFASAVCSAELLLYLETLRCSRSIGLADYDAVLDFISPRNNQLPATVDFSQMQVLPEANFGDFLQYSALQKSRQVNGREFLVDLFQAMQGNAIKELLIRAVIREDAFDRLREYLFSASETTQGRKVAKVLAWQRGEICGVNLDNFLRGQLTVSQFTDFKIESIKSSGAAKGAAFKIRINLG